MTTAGAPLKRPPREVAERRDSEGKSEGARLILSTTSNTLCCAANGPREISELPCCELCGPFTEGDYHGSWIFSGFYSVVLDSYTKMQLIKQAGIVIERGRRRAGSGKQGKCNENRRNVKPEYDKFLVQKGTRDSNFM